MTDTGGGGEGRKPGKSDGVLCSLFVSGDGKLILSTLLQEDVPKHEDDRMASCEEDGGICMFVQDGLDHPLEVPSYVQSRQAECKQVLAQVRHQHPASLLISALLSSSFSSVVFGVVRIPGFQYQNFQK